MSTADPRNRSNNKPWKPEVTPLRRRGGFNRSGGGRQFDNSQHNDKSRNNDSNNGGQNGNNGQRNGNGTFRNRGQGQGNFRGTFHSRGRGQGRLDKSPNVRCPRVASKTVDKDKMRCHYCNEIGHFIRECSKRSKDEEEA